MGANADGGPTPPEMPLAAAIGCDSAAAAEALLAHGALAQRQSPNGNSLVHMAVVAPTPRIIRLLLAHGADLCAPRNTRGDTPHDLAHRLGATHLFDGRDCDGR